MANTIPFGDTSDDEILRLLREPDATRRRGEELLFKRFDYFIAEGIKKYKITSEDAFDAYSDAILTALQVIAAGSFEGRSTLKTYLFRIFGNKCVDIIRKKSTNKQSIHHTISISEMFLQFSDNAKTILQQMSDKTDIAMLQKRLSEIGENCRKLLMLSAAGNSDKALAVMLEYKTSSVVKTTRLRCLEKLRNLYLQKSQNA